MVRKSLNCFNKKLILCDQVKKFWSDPLMELNQMTEGESEWADRYDQSNIQMA